MASGLDVSSDGSTVLMMGSRIFNINAPNLIKKSIACRYCCIKMRQQSYKFNQVHTGKYNVFTFLPLNLMLQFSKMANLYFLIMLCMELYKPISDSDGAPVLALPLATVVGISLVKDLYEDIKRHLSDRDENNRKTKVAMKNREG